VTCVTPQDGSPTEQLHHVSFDMHEGLAETLGVASYRKLPTMSVTPAPCSQPRRGGGDGSDRRSSGGAGDVPWLDGAVRRCSLMDDCTAQVTPLELTQKMIAAAIKGGAKLVIGCVEGVVCGDGDDMAQAGGARGPPVKVTAVVVDGKPIPADRVVFALGPWSVLLEHWLPAAVPMQGIKSTSIVFQHEPADVAPFALFCEDDSNGCHLEVYPRPNGEVWHGEVWICAVWAAPRTSIRRRSPH
jgi:glycine/D-amino acid oxidase-like deaminating enzyme